MLHVSSSLGMLGLVYKANPMDWRHEYTNLAKAKALPPEGQLTVVFSKSQSLQQR